MWYTLLRARHEVVQQSVEVHDGGPVRQQRLRRARCVRAQLVLQVHAAPLACNYDHTYSHARATNTLRNTSLYLTHYNLTRVK